MCILMEGNQELSLLIAMWMKILMKLQVEVIHIITDYLDLKEIHMNTKKTSMSMWTTIKRIYLNPSLRLEILSLSTHKQSETLTILITRLLSNLERSPLIKEDLPRKLQSKTKIFTRQLSNNEVIKSSWWSETIQTRWESQRCKNSILCEITQS